VSDGNNSSVTSVVFRLRAAAVRVLSIYGRVSGAGGVVDLRTSTTPRLSMGIHRDAAAASSLISVIVMSIRFMVAGLASPSG
jgi:hypothetical protein